MGAWGLVSGKSTMHTGCNLKNSDTTLQVPSSFQKTHFLAIRARLASR